MEPDTQRASLRRRLLASRAAVTDRVRREAAVQARVADWLVDFSIDVLGFYWPIRGEPDVTPVALEWMAKDARRRVALPVVESELLRFRAWDGITPLVIGQHGVPMPESGDWVNPQALLIPCVGFDARRYRLGYGGGYYDRTLALGNASGSVRTCGIAFEVSKLETIEPRPHDIALDAIATEAALYR